jgi:hypothetical protein
MVIQYLPVDPAVGDLGLGDRMMSVISTATCKFGSYSRGTTTHAHPDDGGEQPLDLVARHSTTPGARREAILSGLSARIPPWRRQRPT